MYIKSAQRYTARVEFTNPVFLLTLMLKSAVSDSQQKVVKGLESNLGLIQ